MTATPTAGILIIGNEILCGLTQDINTHFIAQHLHAAGILLKETRVVLDDEAAIITAVNALRSQYTYVFTTGGIGPTHDDITASAIAKAFGLKIMRNARAEASILARYPAHTPHTAARLRMADMPQGAHLIETEVSAAPGFYVDNVYVMAGVPGIMQEMLKVIIPTLHKGPKRHVRAVFCALVESYLADDLRALQARYPQVEIGSYPRWRQEEERGVKLVLKSTDITPLDAAFLALQNLIIAHGTTPQVLEEM